MRRISRWRKFSHNKSGESYIYIVLTSIIQYTYRSTEPWFKLKAESELMLWIREGLGACRIASTTQ